MKAHVVHNALFTCLVTLYRLKDVGTKVENHFFIVHLFDQI
jgi:hypothetical protein